MSAALFRVGVFRCASRQLYEALVRPPTNHLANGSFHWSTLEYGLNQCNSPARRPQKPSISPAASFHRSSYSASDLMPALAANSAGGGNIRFSCITVCTWPASDGLARAGEPDCAACFGAIRNSPRKRNRIVEIGTAILGIALPPRQTPQSQLQDDSHRVPGFAAIDFRLSQFAVNKDNRRFADSHALPPQHPQQFFLKGVTG